MRIFGLLAGLGAALVLIAVGCSDKGSAAFPGGAPTPSAAADAGSTPSVDAGPHAVTYADVAPVISANCLACHDHGGAAPFPLTTFEEVAPRSAAMAAAVSAHTMPPWLPGPSCQTFRDARVLTDAQIATFNAWATAGAPQGAPISPIPAKAHPTLAWVDQTVDIGADYVPQGAQGPADDWRCFLLDPMTTEDKMVIGYDLSPTFRGQVHHAGFLQGPVDAARARDAADPGPGWSCPGNVDTPTSNLIGSWASGYGAVSYPAGTGMPLGKGQGLILQMHYHVHDLTKPPVPDRTRISLQYARAATAEASFLSLGVSGINLPPYSKGDVLTQEVTLPSDTLIRGAVGHMHLFGQKIHVEATAPAGSSCLFDVPRWDYRWEEMVFMDPPPLLPAGTKLKLTCTWDNPTDTPVVDGLTLTGEMCDLGFITTPP